MRTTEQQFTARLKGWVVVTLLVGGLAATSGLAQVTAPYSQNFESGPDANFVTGNQISGGDVSTWATVTTGSGNGVLQNSITVNDAYQYSSTYASIQVGNLGGPTNFIESVDVTVTNSSGFIQAVGLVALASGQLYGIYDGAPFFQASYNVGGYNSGGYVKGDMAISYNDGSGYGSNMVETAFTGTTALNVKYHLQLTASYNGPNVLLTFVVSDGTNSTSLSVTPPVTLTGNHFGMVNNYDGDGFTGNITVQYDNYSIVPLVVGSPVQASAAKAIGISWFGSNNVSYQVQVTTSLLGTNTVWTNLGGLVNGTGATNSAFDFMGTAPQKFYQVIGYH